MLNSKEESLWKQLISYTGDYPKEDPYYKYKLTRWCYKISMTNFFHAFIMSIIILNTVTLSFDRYPPRSAQENRIMNILSLLFTIIFTFEVVIKTIGLGFKIFLQDNFNKFDLTIVIISICELLFSSD